MTISKHVTSSGKEIEVEWVEGPAGNLRVPSIATLKTYGGTRDAWYELAEAQGFVCAICEKLPSTGILVIDHEHIAKWKKMPPARRWLYVRGLVCWFCNKHYLGRSLTLRKAKNVVDYLEAYLERRPKSRG